MISPPYMLAIDPLGGMDSYTQWLVGVLLLVLLGASLVGRLISGQAEGTVNVPLVRTFRHRVRTWWMMMSILVASFFLGNIGAVVLFFFVSFWALREFITMTPTRGGDHRTLFWVFFAFTPLQYVLVGMNQYSLFSIVIPVYASLFIPARIAISGDKKRFLERSAKIQLGLLICVYSLSYTPAILQLELTANHDDTVWGAEKPEAETSEDTPEEPAGGAGKPFGLLAFFVLITQAGDVLQYGWGKLVGRRIIAPQINANRSWEGLIGGVCSTSLLGSLLWWVTPFEIWEAALMSMIIAIMGFAGGMTMSAIKRDRGVQDYGTLVQGHLGVLDRIDSLCFAAPVFYHLTKLFFSVHGS